MALTRYAAVLEQSDTGAFGVWFPDFPGCVAAGLTMEEACASAQEALGFHIDGMAQDGEPIPAPAPQAMVGDVMFQVEVDVPATADQVYTRLNVTLPATLVAAIDRVSSGNRSGWLADAAREKLHRDPLVKLLSSPALRR